jgi:PAS domain S-box-containing protein
MKKAKNKTPAGRTAGKTSRLREADFLRALLDNIPDHIYIKDTRHRFVLANRIVIRNLGAASLDEIKNKTDLDFFPLKHARKYFRDEEKVLAGKPVIGKEEFNINQTTQQPEWLLTTKVPIRDRKNKVIGLAGINRDITEVKKLREKERAYVEAVKYELSMASAIQQGFLPERLPAIEGWELASHFTPAEEIGGDFYEAFTFDDGTLVLAVGDVSGKSISAALFMSHVITLLKAFAEQLHAETKSPAGAVELVNKHICRYHPKGNLGTKFVTLFFAVVNTKTGIMEYVNAGHPPPFVMAADATLRRLRPTGPAIGIVTDPVFARQELPLHSGDMLYVFTDGITEAKGPQEELFTEARLEKIVREHRLDPGGCIAAVTDAVARHCPESDKADDITMLALKKK